MGKRGMLKVSGEKQPGAKTLTLSLRLDPKTKFILDFIARIKGQSITTVVERAIKKTADDLGIGPKWDPDGNEICQTTWSDLWDPDEGIRTLKLLADPGYPTSFDEDELKAFTLVHWPFFYLDHRGNESRRGYIEILWPQVGRYIEIWRAKKNTDYWAAGEAMKADLAAARVAAPNWPPKANPPAKPKTPARPANLDDEIPI